MVRTLMTPTTSLRCGAILGALAVAAGAFGAHALRDTLPARDFEIFETAVRYQMFHALALLACAMLDHKRARLAARLFLIGALIFCGSLYALVLFDVRWLGAITPIGGVAWILGWIALATSSVRSRADAHHDA